MKTNDIFGKAMMSWWNGNKDASIKLEIDGTEDDDMPASVFFRSYEEMSDLEKLALKKSRGKILDVGAAAGCHSLILKDRGFQVSPIDVSKEAVQIMKERGLSNARVKNVFHIKNQKYDTILLLMNGLGIGGNLEGVRKLLLQLKNLLLPGGQIFTDATDIIYTMQNDDAAKVISDIYYGEVRFNMKFEDWYQFNHPWIYLDPDTLEELADDCGLNTEILLRGESLDFLCRLTLN